MPGTRTEVHCDTCNVPVYRNDSILVLGSCFAAGIGGRLASEGYDVLVNPFGTLFNPFSIMSSLRRLASGRPFEDGECVQMGAGSGLWCSFSHYTRFARATREEFISDANASLARASAFYRRCSKVIITFGTAWCFRYVKDDSLVRNNIGGIVSNCLKRPAGEFCRSLYGVEAITAVCSEFVRTGGCFGREDICPKDIVFTVSPIRHMADGAHGNALSKATLLLSVDRLLNMAPDAARVGYFPAYEIVLDELRDYSWYAGDLVHPSDEAVRLVCDRFMEHAAAGG